MSEPSLLQDLPQEYLAKLAKMKVAHETVMLDDLQRLAAADRRKVAQMEKRFLGDGGSTEGEAGSEGDPMLIVGDDVRINSPDDKSQRSLVERVLPLLAAIALGGVLGAAATSYVQPEPDAAEPPQWQLRIVDDDNGEG